MSGKIITATGDTSVTITGTTYADTMYDSTSNPDTMIGGGGNDTFYVNNAGDSITESAANSSKSQIYSTISYTLPANVEILTLEGSGLYGAGNSSANKIIDTVGGDTLDGGAGSAGDILQGDVGNDTFIVNHATDKVEANGTENTVLTALSSYALTSNVETLTYVGTGNFTGTGNTLSNLITGSSSGNDVLNGGGNAADGDADTLIGGNGNDTFIVHHTNDVVTAGTGINTIKTQVDFSLPVGVENLTFIGTGDFTGTGNTLANNIIGGSGADTLEGGVNADPTLGDTLQGGKGNDTYIIDNTGDVIIEKTNQGTDTVLANVSYTLPNNVENITITGTGNFVAAGNSLANVIIAGADNGNDTLDGGVGGTKSDTLEGNMGNDTYVVHHAKDIILASSGAGVSLVETYVNYTLSDNLENLTVMDTAKGHYAEGNTLANVITGSYGHDTLNGGLNDSSQAGDTLIGVGGTDTFIVNNTGDVVTETSSSGTSTIKTSVNYTLSSNVQDLILTGTGGIYGAGNSLADYITANSADDTLDGTTADTLGDTLKGGKGNDTYIINNTGDVVIQGAHKGTIDTILANVSYTLPSNVENLTITGTGNIEAIGNTLANIIIAGAGADTIDGGAGGKSNTADTLEGAMGNDTYVVHHAKDIILASSGAGASLVETYANYTLSDNLENLTIMDSTKGHYAQGNTLANIITGDFGHDTLDGGVNDSSQAGDTLQGIGGNDKFIVNNSGDVVTEASTAGTSTIITAVNYTLGSNIENLTYTGTSNFIGVGNSLADYIKGGSGDDTLNGGANADSTKGDTLAGGGGNDTFIVNNTGDLVIEKTNSGAALIDSNVNAFTIASNVENLTFTGTGAFLGVGNTLGNIIQGGSSSDTLDGGTGGTLADTLIGGNGNDTFIVHHTGDVIQAGTGTNTVLTYSDFTLTTNLENITIMDSSKGHHVAGNTLGNVITGNDGHDTLDGGANTVKTVGDTLIGVKGNDLFIVNQTSDIVTESATTGTNTVDSYVNYTLSSNLENLTIMDSAAGHYALGNTLGNAITGNFGSDTLDGGVGGTVADTLKGIGGNDTFIVHHTSDIVSEKATSTAVINTVLTYADYTMSSNLENLTIMDSLAAHHVVGNTLGNVIKGSFAGDTLDGGIGGTSADTLIGVSGTDTFIVHHTNDVVIESAIPGATTINTVKTYTDFTLSSNLENLTIMDATNGHRAVGNTLANVITGNAGHDTLDGALNSTISGGTTPGDTLIGVKGNDSFIIHNTGDIITESASTGTNTVDSYVSYTLSSHLENLTLMDASHAHIVQGNTLANVITGSYGSDTLDGGGSAADKNADTLIGVSGTDTFYVHHTNDVVIEKSSTTGNTVYADVNFTLSSNLEELVVTNSSVGRYEKGNTLSDIIQGLFGNDTLDGGGSATDANADTLIGVGGNDTFIVNHSADSISGANLGTNTVESNNVNYTLNPAIVGNLTLINETAGHYAKGNTAANIITGNYGHDTLDGGLNSTISGGTTPGDTLIGVKGNDTFIMHNTGDIITESATTGTNIVDSYVSYTLSSHLENLTLMDASNAHYVQGNTLANAIVGSYAGDTLDGGGSAADKNADTLTGVSGTDTFIIHHTNDVVIEADTATGITNSVDTYVSFTLSSNLENLTIMDTSAGHYAMGNTLTNVITGIAGANDTLNGGLNTSGGDTLIGKSGNDTFIVNQISDSVVGATGGTNIVESNNTNFTLTPSFAGNLTIINATAGRYAMGDTLANIITGDHGSDTLDGGTNSTVSGGSTPGDTLIGVKGNDTFIVRNTGDVVTETTTAGTNIVDSYANASFTLSSNLENLTIMESHTGHYAMGNTLANVITSNYGSDTLDGGGSAADKNADTLTGVSGTDTFVIHHTNDVVIEADTATGITNSVDTYVSFTLSSNLENLTIMDTSAGHYAMGNTLANVITGIAGANDTLNGGLNTSGGDTLIGKSGNDTFIVNQTSDSISGAAGGTNIAESNNVNYTLSPAFIGNLTIINATAGRYAMGNTLANIITGDYGSDTLDGAANSTITGGSTPGDTLVGIKGNDTFIIHNTADVVTETTTAGINTVNDYINANYTLSSNIENLTIMDNTAGHYIMGSTLANAITGKHGSDTLDGGGSAADNHADTLTGVGGTDTFIIHHTNDVVIESDTATGLTNSVDTYVSFTLSSNLENLTIMDSTAGHFAMAYTSGADSITGIAKGAGVAGDTLADGGPSGGNDTLHGLSGNDTFIVDKLTDSVIGASGGTNTVYSYVNYTLGTNQEILNISDSTAGHYAMGNGVADTITGILKGTGVAGDTLADGGSGGGNDTLHGLSGNDTFVVNKVGDIVTEAGGTTGVINAYVSYALQTGTDMMNLKAASIYGTGLVAGDTIVGFNTAGSGDTLDGGTNDTVAVGSLIGDSLVGATGNDTFIVRNTNDVVTESAGTASIIDAYANYTMQSSTHATILNLEAAGLAGVGAGGDSITGYATAGAGDTLDGGAAGSADTLIGATGNDTFIVRNTGDKVTESAGTASIVDAYASYSILVGNSTTIKTLNLEAAAITGTGYAPGDTITGITTGTAGDTLDGSTNDTGATGDSLVGYTGNDTFLVRNIHDTVTETGGTTGIINAYAAYTLQTGTNLLNLETAGITGTALAAGNDTINAAAAGVTMNGLLGNDTYSIATALGTSWGHMTINDTGGTADTLDLSNIAGLTYSGGTSACLSALDSTGALITNADKATTKVCGLEIAVTGGSVTNYIIIDNYFNGNDYFAGLGSDSAPGGAGCMESIKFSDHTAVVNDVIGHLATPS